MRSLDEAATRRGLIGAGVAASTLAAGLSLGQAQAAPTTAPAGTPSDSDLLVPILGAERLGQFVYARVLAVKLMAPEAQAAATRMLAQERQHTRRLIGELRRLGGAPPPRITSVAEADQVLLAHGIPNRLSRLRSMRDCITVLVRTEALLEGAYFRAIPEFADPQLVTLATQIMACEAQHFSLLNWLLRPGNIQKAVPGPFVEGAF